MYRKLKKRHGSVVSIHEGQTPGADPAGDCIYFGIILFFAVGAGIGGNLSMRLGFKAIWFSSAVLAVSFLLMFIEEKEKSLC